jgi:small redox-active disulfide protein 2
MKIEIFGTGCAKCKRLEKHVRKALKQTELKASVNKIEDMNEIMERGVMITPALAINGEIVLSGKISKVDDIKKLLKEKN